MTAAATSPPTNWWEWLGDSSTRTVSGPIPEQLWTTLWHAMAATALAAALAIPLALWLAHHRRGELLSTWLVNLGRVVPTIAVLGIAVLVSLRNGFGFEPWPIVFALTLLALPPIFANTYTAVRQAPVDAVESSRAMGFTEAQIMTRIELPLALPLIITGVRVALTQLVATEALGALFGGSGLGTYISFGFAASDANQIQAGAILVAGTATVADLSLWLLSRAVLSRGVRSGRRARGRALRGRATNPTPSLGGTPS